MKTKTRIQDIEKIIAGDATTIARIPAPQRRAAQHDVARAREIAAASVDRMAENYSGNTSVEIKFGPRAFASTNTRKGDQYSRRCTYRKTDAAHVAVVPIAGIPALVDSPLLVAASHRDGCPLISLMPDGAAVWLAGGKPLHSVSGWVAYDAATNICYHSTASREAAEKGLAKKLAIHTAAQARVVESRKIQRRLRLVARLCHSVTATVEDARRLGFCTPGIQSFQTRYGIGDAAPLPDLVRTGDPAAIRLALEVARKVSRN